MNMTALPVANRFDLALHLLGGRESQVAAPQRAKPKRRDLDRRYVEESVVKAGKGEARDARVQHVTVELDPVALLFQELSVTRRQKGESRGLGAERQNHQITGDFPAIVEAETVWAKAPQLGAVRLDRAAGDRLEIAIRRQGDGGAKIADESVRRR